MNHSERVSYFHPALWLNSDSTWVRIQNCTREMRRLIVSNDGKYLFVCKLYSDWCQPPGYAYLYIYDLVAKIQVEGWCFCGNGKDFDDWKTPQNMSWIEKYPECIHEFYIR